MRVQLLPLDGGSPIDITKDLLLVGRREDCDLQLDHKSVSKLHCVIVKTDGLLLLRDLGSTNGTRVNGQRVRRAALLPNDQLHIASLRYRVVFHQQPEPIDADGLTQQIDADEMRDLLNRAKAAQEHSANHAEEDSDPEIVGAVIQANVLPDIYPDNAPPAKEG